MEYKQLGTSDLKISRIGFGCMSLKPGQPDAIELLHKAIAGGINYFDTADLYDKGLNEELLGKAFKGKRDQVIIATKAGNQWRADGSGWDWNPSKEYILACAENSLKRLEVDHIDLFQLHGGTINDPIEETIEAFEILLKQGKIRYYGISSIRPNVIREYVKRSNIVGVMMQYSLLDRRPEEEALNFLHKHNIGVVVRGSVASGLLVNKPAKPYLDRSEEEVAQAKQQVHHLAAARTPAQTAIQYVLSHPAVTSAVVGIRTMEQLQEAIGTFDAPRLNRNEMKQLQNVVRPNVYAEHR